VRHLSSNPYAQVVKLVDTPASGVGDASREGSSPFLGTKFKEKKRQQMLAFFIEEKYQSNIAINIFP
jgi:hypothetical protein